MYNAPPVVYPVGRFVAGLFLQMAVCGLSAVGMVNWQMQTGVTGPTLWAGWLMWTTCVLSAAFWAPRQALTHGRLGWSGDVWFWQADADAFKQAQVVAVSVGLDTGQGLLLWVQPLDERGRAQGRRASAWLKAGAMPSKWHGFRCAVYSRPKTVALSDGRPQEDV